MKLSKRLQLVADLINPNTKIIDVGCDHALLDIYLTLFKECDCTAIDISEKAIVNAKENIIKYSLLNKVKVICQNGLNNINYKDKVVIILGMGTNTILNILKYKKPKEMIISSHNNISTLRRKIIKKGYYIKDEKVVYEKNKYYVVIVFELGKQNYSYLDYEIGLFRNNYEAAYINYLLLKLYKKPKNRYNSMVIDELNNMILKK